MKVQKKYFNIRSSYGIETVDELNSSDFDNYMDFIKELRRLKKEYHIAGIPVYISQRPCKEWKMS